MKSAKDIFYALIKQRNITAGIYEYLQKNHISLDSSDLLRWQWVLAVSALDKYIHVIVLLGMLAEFQGKRNRTKKYDTFTLEISTYLNIQNSDTPELEFSKAITNVHSHLAFQDPDKIADALSYIWEEQHKWQVVSSNMQTPISQNDLKVKLRNIVVRRNQIVHQGDCMAVELPSLQQSITQSDTEDVISFITEIVEAIDKSIS